MENKNLEVFSNAPVPQAVLKNVLPAMAAMLMVLIYNLADTFFIGQTRNDILIAAVSLAMPVFLIFMAVGTVFGIGGTSVISRAFGQGRQEYAPVRYGAGPDGLCEKGLFFLYVELRNCRFSAIRIVLIIHGPNSGIDRRGFRYAGTCKALFDHCQFWRDFCPDFKLLLQHYPRRGAGR